MSERNDHDKMIPGEHDRTTQAPTPPGVTTGYGADAPADVANDPTVNDEGHEESALEGGGRTSERQK